MEEQIPTPQLQAQPQTGAIAICPQCHLPVLPEYYFCPNCGQKLHVPPLETGVSAQVWLYIFSAILPFIAYLAITKWRGIAYMRSSNARARVIGWIALGILVASSVFVFWWTAMWIDQTINSAMTDASSIGSFGSGL